MARAWDTHGVPDNNWQSPRRTEWEAAQRRLREHPGHIEHLRIQAFATTLLEVFRPNYLDLIGILDQVSSDPDVALQLSGTLQGHVPGADNVISRITRYLHNYVASAMTLVDHGRRLTDRRSGPIADEYERRKAEMLQFAEISFLQGLRNFSLHRSLPILAYTLTVTRDQMTSSEVELSTADLLSGDKWTAQAREFIEKSGERLQLRPVSRKHFELVSGLNLWLVNTLQEENREALNEVNELVVAANASLMGVDHETARQRMDQEPRIP